MAAPRPTVVICVDHAFVSGGQAKVAIESALGLAAHGARPILFAAAAPVDERLTKAGVEMVCLDQHDLLGNPSRAAAAVQGTWNLAAARALADLLARLPRDETIVHVHGWAKALSPSIAAPIRASGLPALYTLHEYFLFCPNGGFYDYQTNEVCHRTPLSPSCWATHCDSRNYPRKLWRNARLTVAQRLARLPEIFSDYVCISDYQQQIVGPYLPKRARLHRVSNPIDCENLGRKSDPATGDVIFVGRLSAEKGAFLFAEAAARAGLRPAFIGDGPIADELRTRYPQARFLGWLPPDRVRAEMRAARALAFPSLWYEGQPLTVLEAKAMGTPIVVSDICAGREEVEDGVGGLWFSSGDVDSLEAALLRLKDDALVARLSDGAYDAFWRDPPTLDRHVERILAVYAEVRERKRVERREECLQKMALPSPALREKVASRSEVG
ncbi:MULTISPECIES: glycosyltransferase family 4 protein [Methylosinus]|uniref:Glycosyl transferase family 1 n=1 Tax=Methylosinus trichosporium (strain ATCC 35070 / NCIMB 11131 / UNIQEM 75 / OB3b) TaxID=595536 RepID=A0A2D2CZF7_METT3|nr:MULTISPECIES: glycosyltransferase family 4 protein [Methylosinus]ATQ68029.1 glycosyl transferase family 1 [Methylosinus trichosporium OB3b]OBS53696.1 glycosyl transferase family 1 [Methylosinus sp. 3S-1]